MATMVALLLPGAVADAQDVPVSAGASLVGVVLDAATGAPVAGAFLSVVPRGPRAIADGSGRFMLGGVSPGPHRILVERFGYRALEVRVEVDDPPVPLEVRLDPDPVALEGLEVAGEARVAVSGIVMEAGTDRPIPHASLWVRDVRRGSADDRGVFRISDVPTGPRLVLVERLGYVSQYVPVSVTAPPVPLELRLQPDSLVLAGLRALEAQMDARRRAASGLSQTFDEGLLRGSASRGIRRFLQDDALLPLEPCSAREASLDCRVLRGTLLRPRVYVDELEVSGLDHLGSFEPGDLYSLDVFVCTAADLRSGWEIRAYTYAYMERMARRPRLLLRSCT